MSKALTFTSAWLRARRQQTASLPPLTILVPKDMTLTSQLIEIFVLLRNSYVTDPYLQGVANMSLLEIRTRVAIMYTTCFSDRFNQNAFEGSSIIILDLCLCTYIVILVIYVVFWSHICHIHPKLQILTPPWNPCFSLSDWLNGVPIRPHRHDAGIELVNIHL